jgi:thiamine-phosphate pyrophosphorylase
VRGFYAVVDGEWDEALAEKLVRGGACALQLRMKKASTRSFLAAAEQARAFTRLHGIPYIVNDRLDVALAVGADGVHLGQDDLPPAAARAIAPKLIIGFSTHNVEQVRAASGADYLGFGPVFATSTKENPDPVQGLDGLAAAVRATRLPIVAIGGITPEHAAAIRAVGAAAACAISSVNRAPDPVAAARLIAAAWSH